MKKPLDLVAFRVNKATVERIRSKGLNVSEIVREAIEKAAGYTTCSKCGQVKRG